MKALCTDEQFIAAWKETGGYGKAMRAKLGFSSDRSIGLRRRSIERRLGIILTSASLNSTRNVATLRSKSGRRIEITMPDGVIVVGSDAHVWPGSLTTAQRGFIKVIEQVKPSVVIMNGDVFDGARVSRFPAGIWDQEDRPDVRQELEACQAFLTKVQRAAKGARLIWTWGNHDARFEMRLAANAKEYKGVPGFALKDHFPEWEFCMAVFVNGDIAIKHRLAGGAGAKRQNTIRAGMHVVTGHLHALGCQERTDYRGTWYGTDSGTLADPESKQFDYCEEGPKDWRSGHPVLSIRNGRLTRPEFAQVWDDDHVEFRGELIRV